MSAVGEWSHYRGYLCHWDLFLYSSVYSCPLFLISSVSISSMLLLSFIVPIFAWNISLVSLIFLKRSLVFSILLFSFISLHWSRRKAFLSLLAILWNFAFRWLYLSFLLCVSLLFFLRRPLQQPFCLSALIFLVMVLISASCSVLWTSIHSSAGTLSDLIPWIYLSLPLYNHKGFDLGYTWMVKWFSILSSI